MIVTHRLEILMEYEGVFRQLMLSHGFSIPDKPHPSSKFPRLAFLVRADLDEKFDFLRPRFLPPRDGNPQTYDMYNDGI